MAPGATRGVYLTGVLGVLAVYYWFLAARWLNIPFQDDIFDIVQFIVRMHNANNPGESISALFSQLNEHRTGASRIIYYVLFMLQGEIDFRTITLVANLALPALAILYGVSLTDRRQTPLFILVAILVLCQPRAYALMLWAMSSFAFFYVCVYALSSFYCLGSRSSWSLPVAIACAIAGTFSLASGQTIWFFGALYLAWQVWVSGQRSRLELVVWAVAGLLCLSIFHYQFTTLNTVGFMLGQLWLVPCHILGFFLAIVGSAFSFGSLPAALAIGVLLTSGFIVLLIRDSQQKNLGPMHFFAAFLFASALVVALGRAPYSSLDYSLSDRYSFTSLNILLAMLVLVCNRGLLAWRGAAVTLLTAGLVLSAASYSYYTPQADEQVEKRLRQFEKARYRAFGYPHIETRAIVQSAIDNGLYHPPAP